MTVHVMSTPDELRDQLPTSVDSYPAQLVDFLLRAPRASTDSAPRTSDSQEVPA